MTARAFVVGNGPSLAWTNLNLLKGEVSFATNRIHLAYEKTDWRPTYYVRSEGFEYVGTPSPLLWEKDLAIHLDDPSVEVHGNLYFLKHLNKRDAAKLKPIKTCAHHIVHYDSEQCPHLWHLPVLCTYGSTVNVCIQMAVKMGFEEIYLVGCDLGYEDGKPSHFDDRYEIGYEGLLREARYSNLDILTAHIVAKRSSPVPIYNATIGGNLEVYDRVDYEGLFK